MNLDSIEQSHDTLCRLITAFHILHKYEVLDERGQVSIRNPHEPTTFFTSNTPPVLISSRNDIDQRNVSDGSPVVSSYGRSETGSLVDSDSEHFIHSCLYDRFPGVNCIVHSHSLSAIAYGLCNSRGSILQPTYQMVGFIGQYVPIFDAAAYYAAIPSPHFHNLVINHKYLGDALAKMFEESPGVNGPNNVPAHRVVVQRGHGFVAWGHSLEDAVFKAIHLCRNAAIQTTAMAQRAQTDLEAVYLSEKEAKDCENTIDSTVQHAWAAWATVVGRTGLYHNELKRL